MTVHWSLLAVNQLKSIFRFIAADDPDAAQRFTSKLEKRVKSLGRFPNRGRIVPEVNLTNIRELVEGNYRLLYRVQTDAVEVLSIFEGHKKFDGIDSAE